MTDVKWLPTGRLRLVEDTYKNAFLQQEWARGERDESGKPVTQWRVIPAVREKDLTAEELGIVKTKDLPND
jgi:hypothetical protein